MNAQQFWQLFLETGAPEVYLMYNRARKTEENNVFNRTGTGPTGDDLQ